MFEGNPVTVDGIVIPSDHPVFLAVIAVHVAAGLTCVVSGVFAMLARKRRGLHTKAGKVYYYALWVVFITSCFVAFIRWEEDYHLFILGVVSFGAAFIGRRTIKAKKGWWPVIHISGMAVSYIFLLIAFYVDNGRFLPLWKDISPVYYWLIPLAIGIPLLLFVLLTNPLSRGYFRRS
jgi:uncharacterized membrane protein